MADVSQQTTRNSMAYTPLVNGYSSLRKPTIASSFCTPKRCIFIIASAVIAVSLIYNFLLYFRHIYSDIHLRTDIDGELVIVDKALVNKYGAICLDGISSPGYYIKRGIDDGEKRWLLAINHSPWCNSLTECQARASVPLEGTMSDAPVTIQFSGILSSDPDYNRYFSDWNMVQLVPCDGASYLGNQTMLDDEGKTILSSLGASIIQAVMEHLIITTDIEKADQIVLYGRGSGAISMMLYTPFIKSKLPYVPEYTLIAHSGLLVDVRKAKYNLEIFFDLHNIKENSLLIKCSDIDCFESQSLTRGQTIPLILFSYLESHWPVTVLYGCIDELLCKANHYHEKYREKINQFLTSDSVKSKLSLTAFGLPCDWPLETTVYTDSPIINGKSLNSLLLKALINPENKLRKHYIENRECDKDL